jgi:hypothetical protein
MHGEVDVQLYTFLTSTLDMGKQSASCTGLLTPRENASPHYPLDRMPGESHSWFECSGEKKKIPAPLIFIYIKCQFECF